MHSCEHHYGVERVTRSTPFWIMECAHHSGAQRGVSSVNNIELLRKQRGWKRPHLAKLMGTSPQQIERLEKGVRSLRQEWIDKAAKAFGVTPAEIITEVNGEVANLTGNTLPTAVDANSGNEVALIQKLDLSLSMGPGTHIDDWVESDPVSFDLNFIRAITRTTTNHLRLVTGIGDSMYPTLNWGDVIMIDTTDRMLARQDGVYWIDCFGAAGIKRLRAVGKGRILIVSDNPGIPDQEVDAEDLRIQGRAIWFGRAL